jgi:membrane associated rhomboid family serine protease
LPILFFPFFFELPAVLYLGVWFFSQLFSGTLALTSPEHVEGIAWWAHIGGFIAGMALCPLFVRRRTRHVHELDPDDDGIDWAWQPRRY